MRRTNNQDSLAVVVTDDAATWASRGHLLMVADGMGAHAAGELASKLAADNIPHTYFKLRDLYPPAALRQAIRDANALIHAKGQSSIGFHGMGTTCSCLVLLPQGALVAHVGDSRVYRLRGHRLEQLTFDHSLVWEMAAAGQMAEEDVPAYIPKNVITRSLGPHPTVNIDLEGPFDAAAGDVFLLCSDGLSGQITDEEIGALLHCLPPEEAVADAGRPGQSARRAGQHLRHRRAGVDRQRLPDRETAAGRDEGHGDRRRAPAATRASFLPVTCVATLFALTFCLVNEWWIASIVAGAALLTSLGLLLSNRSRTGGRCGRFDVARRPLWQRALSRHGRRTERKARRQPGRAGRQTPRSAPGTRAEDRLAAGRRIDGRRQGGVRERRLLHGHPPLRRSDPRRHAADSPTPARRRPTIPASIGRRSTTASTVVSRAPRQSSRLSFASAAASCYITRRRSRTVARLDPRR